MLDLELGSFVTLAPNYHGPRGFGTLVAQTDETARVRFFDTPDDPTPPEVTVPRAALHAATLPEQTRVFHYDRALQRWRVGRVLEDGGRRLLIQFPNRDIQEISREALATRWREPVRDPALFLARGVTETPRFAYARAGFLGELTTQRAACLGMTALPSSRIELVEYQFNVIRRVLQDPVQRYLLADEVGLGKTIEAGVLIRQYLLDGGTQARALVIVPTPLVGQWRRELRERFLLADWLGEFLLVVAADDLTAIDAHLDRVGMLVVDEAHHLSRAEIDGTNPLYERIRARAQSLNHLLLLSATPVLADTAGFLRVLHLLDPLVFPLQDLAGFERRLNARQLVAETVASLDPSQVLTMEDDLDRLQQTFGDDTTLQNLIDRLRPIVQQYPAADNADFRQALNALRAHLTETYRLHRRILRNRRRAVPWATPRRAGLEIVGFYNPATGTRAQRLDELRVHLLNLGCGGTLLQELFADALHPRGALPLAPRLVTHGVDDDHALHLVVEVDRLTADDDAGRARITASVAAVSRVLADTEHQVVVFCDQFTEAERLTEALRQALGATAVARHETLVTPTLSTIPDEETDEADDLISPWQIFLREPTSCRVLVCDARAEEGLNLHGGRKVALHHDLPPSPNRVEQRLGRLDRFGHSEPIRSLAVVCLDDQAEQSWLRCLDQGFGVFRQSVASLQYLIEEVMRRLATEWQDTGVVALDDECARLAGEGGWVTRERRRIDQQDALDSLAETGDDAFAALEEAEEEWAEWGTSFHEFAVNNLLFQAPAESWKKPLPRNERVFRLAYERDGDRAATTLMPLPTFTRSFLGTIDVDHRNSRPRHPLTHPYAYRRNTALSREGQERGVRPLRCGDPLIESFSAFCAVDDRGRAFAMWRHVPGYQALDASGSDLFFRFDLAVEADPTTLPSDSEATHRALHRRATAVLPAQRHTLWVGSDGIVFSDTPPVLIAPYSPRASQAGGRDLNLNPQRWHHLERAQHLPWLPDWATHCQVACNRAVEHLQCSTSVQQALREAHEAVDQQRTARLAQMWARAQRLEGVARVAEMSHLKTENELYERLAQAVREPNFRVDVAGAVFVAAHNPFAVMA